jgi:hypothetical protein
MQALAERIEGMEIGTTVQPTGLNGVNIQTSVAYRRGGWVNLSMNFQAPGGGLGQSVGIATLPVGYRPPHDYFFVANNGAVFITIIMAAAGHLACTSHAIPANEGIYGTIFFPAAAGAAP